MSQGSIAVEVASGISTYLGNIEFITPPFVFQDVRLRMGERKDDVARGVLARYPNLPLEMRSPVPHAFTLDCDLSQGREACYAP